MTTASRLFHVSIHDVAAPYATQVATVLEALRPLLDTTMSAALVPAWHGQTGTSLALVQFVAGRCAELLLHGYTHLGSSRHPLAWLTAGNTEFLALDNVAAGRRVWRGQAWMSAVTGRPADGFVAPCWQYGPLTAATLAEHGCWYTVHLACLADAAGRRRPLATWSWDAGRVAALGLAAELTGWLHSHVAPRAVRQIVFHPHDIARGYLRRGLRLVEHLLADGYTPVLLRNLVTPPALC